MQTFLPFADFTRSAQVLDRQRLGKQRVETMQIMHSLTGWKVSGDNEPLFELVETPAPPSIKRHWVTLMWEGYLPALMMYQQEVCIEWERREYDTGVTWAKSMMIYEHVSKVKPGLVANTAMPHWFGFEPFHLAMRSQLLQKDPAYYEFLFEPGTPMNLEYLHPGGK